MLVRNVADEVVGKNVQVNAVGTNFMDFPEFLEANRVTDDESAGPRRGQVPMGRLGTLDELANLAMRVPRRHQPVHHRAVRGLCRRMGVTDMLVLDSLQRRMRAMHSLYYHAVARWTLDHVNHFEREPVLPIAFSLFHFTHIEDGSATMLGAGPMIYDEAGPSAWG